MSDVVVISGHPRPGSRTLQLAMAVGKRFAAHRGHVTFVTIDVAELGQGLLAPADAATGEALREVQDATLLIVATPTCWGTYSGALKVLLDQLPPNALAGVLAVPVVTADIQARADAAEAFLARLLSELGADVVDFGLTAIGPELADPAAVADQYAEAIGT
ncbi:NADPH-dependent FMN reductase [Actinoplanes sp. ATCC 53533]|uniref:NADPH-dependent FMN reductase n=1 Tax=Actinoplanes sp. ATCC 53533 TaxID=1288362 RepID=UPI000F7AF2B7|nr:NAD(P)H-dependent oxidoreductase [Actinoplanes sp. ATCC 53533]RSM49280.1 NADPH-dependent FMN reductase [Actinoplanes sp. ATCC 53533]